MENDLYRMRKLKVLQLVLVLAGCGWGLSLWFLVMPWGTVMNDLVAMGAQPVAYDPFLNYWMRLVAVTFFAVAGLCFLVAWRPQKYVSVIPLLAVFHILLGVTGVASAFVIGLDVEHHPTLVSESVFSLGVGSMVWFFGCSRFYVFENGEGKSPRKCLL